MHGQWGAHKITGRLGDGTGKLRATTVSGSIALLRRPPREEEPWEAEAWEDPEAAADPTADPVNGTRHSSGDNSVSGGGDEESGAPADGTTDKKVL